MALAAYCSLCSWEFEIPKVPAVRSGVLTDVYDDAAREKAWNEHFRREHPGFTNAVFWLYVAAPFVLAAALICATVPWRH